MKKNIIHITGNDSHGVELELKRWLGAFTSKYGNINIDRYDLWDATSLKWIWDMILMSGLFAEKRLFIFRWWRDRKSKALGIEAMLEEKLDSIPDDHFLLFHNIWEKEEWLITWLGKNADTRKIDTLWDLKAWEWRSDLDSTDLSLILRTYREAESAREKYDTNILLGHDIVHTMEMVSITKESGHDISTIDIIWLCHGYSWDSMFTLVAAIMAIDISLALNTLHKIASANKVDEWLGGLISNVRNYLYIKCLKHHGSSEKEIIEIVKIHPFVIKKWYSAKINYLSLQKLYKNLVMTSIAYKRGKWLKDSELWRVLAIELALVDLQKYKNL